MAKCIINRLPILRYLHSTRMFFTVNVFSANFVRLESCNCHFRLSKKQWFPEDRNDLVARINTPLSL